MNNSNVKRNFKNNNNNNYDWNDINKYEHKGIAESRIKIT